MNDIKLSTKLLIITVMLFYSCIYYSCTTTDNDTYPVEKLIYIPVKDTISNKANITRIVELEHELQLTRDTLYAVRDSIGEDLFVARYKLARIKYYNDIAGKGNNVKYLRGWINRVFKE